MKKNILKTGLIAVFVVLLSTVTGCNKNGENFDSDLTISFQTKLNGANYALNNIYRNGSDVDVKFEKFQFYLSDITFVNSDGDERLVSEIELFKFNENGLAAVDVKIPKGKYETIKFGIGVKKEFNEADPANYSEEGHPLNTTENTYWGWATMYRFITAEGRYDADLNGEFEGTFAYHTGHEESYRTASYTHEIEISKKEINFLNFNIEMDDLLDYSGNEVDMVSEPYYHGGMENFHLSEKISDNMVSAISIATE